VPLTIVGIDEAGYGPLLGPLTVGAAAFRVEGWQEGDPAPDLWALLDGCVARKGVGRGASAGRARVLVDDSKKLKLASGGKRHPLTLLERGVLAFVAALGARPATDAELLGVLGVKREPHPWYAGEAAALPVGGTAEEVGIACNQFCRRLLEHAGACEVVGLRCESIGETRFNAIVRETGTKAAATARGVSAHLKWAWERFSKVAEGEAVRVVCDRQGGRSDYADELAKMVPGAMVKTLECRAERSRYELAGVGEDGAARGMTVVFQPEAESAHMPVALASMTAKLVRELMMARFNRYWTGLMPELKPTAGYREDGARWVRDAERGGVLSGVVRGALCRIA
jgi:hypothetical protein